MIVIDNCIVCSKKLIVHYTYTKCPNDHMRFYNDYGYCYLVLPLENLFVLWHWLPNTYCSVEYNSPSGLKVIKIPFIKIPSNINIRDFTNKIKTLIVFT